jgi:hypothetical protein
MCGTASREILLRKVAEIDCLEQRWLRQAAVKVLLMEGYGEDRASWFVRDAREVRPRGRKT